MRACVCACMHNGNIFVNTASVTAYVEVVVIEGDYLDNCNQFIK